MTHSNLLQFLVDALASTIPPLSAIVPIIITPASPKANSEPKLPNSYTYKSNDTSIESLEVRRMTKRSRIISPRIKPFINKLFTSLKRDELAAVNRDNKMLSGVERNSDGPPERLGGMVAEYIRSMTEVRVATEFRDYVAWAHQELQTDDIKSVLWTHPPPPTPNLDWQVFESQLAQDEEKLRIHRLITR
ncbi:MAG: hypothetical protein L6R42_006148, partial [Xanthoria sp. 1 TBL-2021]